MPRTKKVRTLSIGLFAFLSLGAMAIVASDIFDGPQAVMAFAAFCLAWSLLVIVGTRAAHYIYGVQHSAKRDNDAHRRGRSVGSAGAVGAGIIGVSLSRILGRSTPLMILIALGFAALVAFIWSAPGDEYAEN